MLMHSDGSPCRMSVDTAKPDGEPAVTPIPSDTSHGAKTDAQEGSGLKVSRARLDLFLISVLILFLELACIRWFPAHVLFLTFFTNTVLLACFLGMSVGCLAARHRRNYLTWTPVLLVVALAAAHGTEH